MMEEGNNNGGAKYLEVDDVPVATVSQLTVSQINSANLHRKSDAEGVHQLVFHFSCLAIPALLMHHHLHLLEQDQQQQLGSVAIFAGSVVLYAFVMSFFFHPLHECVHRTAFRSDLLNAAFGLLFGLATGRPPRHYLLYHYAHHRHTGDPAKDPELQNSWIDIDINSIPRYLVYISGVPFWIDRISTLLRHALGAPLISQHEFYISTPQQKQAIVNEARFFVFVYAAALYVSVAVAHSSLLFWYWALPALLGQPFLRFYLIAEHTGCVKGSDMMSNTRTTLTHRFYRKLAWNMPYHSEHHAWPFVPFHHLLSLHRLNNGRSVSASKCDPSGRDGYVAVNSGVIRKFL